MSSPALITRPQGRNVAWFVGRRLGDLSTLDSLVLPIAFDMGEQRVNATWPRVSVNWSHEPAERLLSFKLRS